MITAATNGARSDPASHAPHFVRTSRSERPWPFEAREERVLNKLFDAFAGAPQSFLGIEVPAYLALAVCGIAGGFVVLAGLGLVRDVPLSILAALSVLALMVFVLVGLARQWIAGRESHVVLEGVILVLGAVAVAARWTGQPVWTVLDVFVAGIGTFLASGRIGCLLAGCCHGRPCSIGIRYGGEAHDELAGIRLFPVQLVESLWLVLVTVIASALVVSNAEPGVAFWFWMIAYATGRFVLDFARGDVRARWGSLTEAQWTCVAVLGARMVQEALQGGGFDAPQFVVVSAAVLLVPVGYATRDRWLSLPASPLRVTTVAEWQVFLDALERDAGAHPTVAGVRRTAPSGACTIRLQIDGAPDGRRLHSYALHGQGSSIDRHTAVALAGMIAQRLPAHVILRAGFCDAHAFHYWALVDPLARAGSTTADDSWLVWLRARAFASLVRESIAMTDDAPPPVDPPLPNRFAPAASAERKVSSARYFGRSE